MDNTTIIDEVFHFIEYEAMEDLKQQNVTVGNETYDVSDEYIDEHVIPGLEDARESTYLRDILQYISKNIRTTTDRPRWCRVAIDRVITVSEHKMEDAICDPCSLGDVCSGADTCLGDVYGVCDGDGDGAVTTVCLEPCYEYDYETHTADYLCDQESQMCYVEDAEGDETTSECRQSFNALIMNVSCMVVEYHT